MQRILAWFTTPNGHALSSTLLQLGAQLFPQYAATLSVLALIFGGAAVVAPHPTPAQTAQSPN